MWHCWITPRDKNILIFTDVPLSITEEDLSGQDGSERHCRLLLPNQGRLREICAVHKTGINKFFTISGTSSWPFLFNLLFLFSQLFYEIILHWKHENVDSHRQKSHASNFFWICGYILWDKIRLPLPDEGEKHVISRWVICLTTTRLNVHAIYFILINCSHYK